MNLKHTRFPRILKDFGYEKYVQYIAFKLKGVEKEACASNINGEPFGLSPYTVPLICDGSGFTSADMFSLKGKNHLENSSNEASLPFFALIRHVDVFACMP